MADYTRQFDTDRLENDETQSENLVKRKLVRDPEADNIIEDTDKPLLDEGRLSKKQRLHLSTVAGLADEEGFDERNEALVDELIPPTVLEYSADTADEAEVQEPGLISQSQTNLMDHIGPTLTYEGMLAASGSLDPVAVGLHDDESHLMAVAAPTAKPLTLRDFPPEAKIAIGIVALAVPMLGIAIFHQSTEDAKVDQAQAKEVFKQAVTSERSQSLAQRPEKTYRQAAPAAIVSAPLSASKTANNFEESDLENWHPSEKKMAAPTPDEIAEGNRHIEAADKMLSVGKEAQAAAYLSAALGKCPANVTLRVATIKAYVAAKKYKSAHAICAEGMRNARTAAEFATLKAQLVQIPSMMS